MVYALWRNLYSKFCKINLLRRDQTRALLKANLPRYQYIFDSDSDNHDKSIGPQKEFKSILSQEEV